MRGQKPTTRNPPPPDRKSRHFSGKNLNVGVKPRGGEVGPFYKESTEMRDRKKQRELRKTVGREARLDRKNAYGNDDLTPYQAVKNIIKKEGAAK